MGCFGHDRRPKDIRTWRFDFHIVDDLRPGRNACVFRAGSVAGDEGLKNRRHRHACIQIHRCACGLVVSAENLRTSLDPVDVALTSIHSLLPSCWTAAPPPPPTRPHLISLRLPSVGCGVVLDSGVPFSRWGGGNGGCPTGAQEVARESPSSGGESVRRSA